MASPLYRDYEKLVNITILGKPFQVPENNICLRAFQFISPDTIPYGRYCWNQECQYCRITYTMASQPDSEPRSVLACKVIVAKGMQITELSHELRYNLMGGINPSEPRPIVDDFGE